MTMHSQVSRQQGFSLMELLVALVVTMMIAGGIFGLLYDSNRTFGREPAVSEQQQNARIAMSLIESDVLSAGAGAGAFSQIFTNGLDDTATDSDGAPSPPSVINLGSRSDALEVRSAVDDCSSLRLCIDPNSSEVTLMETIPDCMQLPGLVMLTDTQGHSYTRWVCVPGGGTSGNCGSGGPNGHVTFPHGAGARNCTTPGDYCNPAGNVAPDPFDLPAFMTAIKKVRYEVRMAADGVPSLWRSPTGGSASTASGNCEPASYGGANNDWRLVARGIEDLQVRYWREANGTPDRFDNTPGVVTDLAYDTIVRQVEVRLSARVLAPHRRVEGETTVAGQTSRRAELRTVITPRAALMALQAAGQFR